MYRALIGIFINFKTFIHRTSLNTVEELTHSNITIKFLLFIPISAKELTSRHDTLVIT